MYDQNPLKDFIISLHYGIFDLTGPIAQSIAGLVADAGVTNSIPGQIPYFRGD